MNTNALCPIEILFRDKNYLMERIRSCGGEKRTVVVAERFTASLWGIEVILDEKVNEGAIFWLDKAIPNPTQADVIESIESIGDFQPNEIIAIGGGSSIDLSKAISAFYYLLKDGVTAEKITEVIKSGAYRENNKNIDIIAIPSTSGTGSEVTKWATIWDINKKEKFSIDNYTLYAHQAIIIPELTCSLPAKLTLSTGLDALCHASEAFWAKPTTDLVKDTAYRAIEIILGNLKATLREPDVLEHREAMARGSLLAGLAFAQTRTTACHSISYPMTMKFGVPHGLACAISLDQVSKINRNAMKSGDLLFALYNQHGGLKNWIGDVCDGILTLNLRSFGIPKEGIDIIVENTFTKGRMDNNPVDISPEKVKEILLNVY